MATHGASLDYYLLIWLKSQTCESSDVWFELYLTHLQKLQMERCNYRIAALGDSSQTVSVFTFDLLLESRACWHRGKSPHKFYFPPKLYPVRLTRRIIIKMWVVDKMQPFLLWTCAAFMCSLDSSSLRDEKLLFWHQRLHMLPLSRFTLPV